MEREPFKIDMLTDPTDEQLEEIMEEVGVHIREETLKVKRIHEQRLNEIFSAGETGIVHSGRS